MIRIYGPGAIQHRPAAVQLIAVEGLLGHLDVALDDSFQASLRCAVCWDDGSDRVEQGQFGADMQVGLINDGPVTFRMRVR